MNKRRKLILSSAAWTTLGWHNAGVAQPKRVPLIAVLIHGTEESQADRMTAFREGMRALGYAENTSYRMAIRWSDNRLEQLRPLARELLALKPDVAVGSPVLGAQAFFEESKTVPIVMASGSGALRAGLIKSMARPGRNVTGLTNQGDELTQKLFELLHEVSPQARRVATLSSGHAIVEQEVRGASRAAATALGIQLVEMQAATAAELRDLAGRLIRERCDGLVVLLDPTLTALRKEVVALATTSRLPATYAGLEYAETGGLMGYLSDNRQLFRRAAIFVDKILKGASHAELPVEQPTKFQLVVNMKAAKMLGIKIPQSVLVRADRVIE